MGELDDSTKEIERKFERYDDLMNVRDALRKYGEKIVRGIVDGKIEVMGGYVRESEIAKYLNK